MSSTRFLLSSFIFILRIAEDKPSYLTRTSSNKYSSLIHTYCCGLPECVILDLF